MQNDEFKGAFIAAIRSGGSERERAFRFFEEKLAPSFKQMMINTADSPLMQIFEEFNVKPASPAQPAAALASEKAATVNEGVK